MRTLLVVLLATSALAQENPLSDYNQFNYRALKAVLLRSAEQMPEEHYSFKPTEAVRSYGQIVGHIADSHYLFCSAVLGQTNPLPNIEKTKTSKADLIAALNGAFAYCDPAFDGLTDANAAQMVKYGPGTPRLSVLNLTLMHNALHYGNLITYMRLKNVVPPTSEPDFAKGLRQLRK